MNLYLLKVTEKAYRDYDCARGFVVRATDEDAARALIATAWDRREFGFGPGDEGARTWLESELSTCKLLAEGVWGDEKGILRDFHAG